MRPEVHTRIDPPTRFQCSSLMRRKTGKLCRQLQLLYSRKKKKKNQPSAKFYHEYCQSPLRAIVGFSVSREKEKSIQENTTLFDVTYIDKYTYATRTQFSRSYGLNGKFSRDLCSSGWVKSRQSFAWFMLTQVFVQRSILYCKQAREPSSRLD